MLMVFSVFLNISYMYTAPPIYEKKRQKNLQKKKTRLKSSPPRFKGPTGNVCDA